MHRAVEQFRPDVVVIDPMTNLLTVGTQMDVRAMLTRMIDFLKMREHHRAVHEPDACRRAELEATETMISSLMDTWVLLTADGSRSPPASVALRLEVARHAAF